MISIKTEPHDYHPEIQGEYVSDILFNPLSDRTEIDTKTSLI
jgi:hypothetical protein